VKSFFPRAFFLIAAFAAAGLACKRELPESSQASTLPLKPELPSRAEMAPAESHPRRYSDEELQGVMLWVSHILIRHRDIKDPGIAFAPTDWRAAPPPARTREQARSEAEALASALQREPDQFFEQARIHSEDTSTRERGGTLGGVSAFDFAPWPAIVDVLAVTGPGGVTNPVETEYGFHIFKLHAPPVEEVVSGTHIVIAYDDAHWLHELLARGTIPPRSRDEAFQLAMQVYESARAKPDDFAELIQRYSEHRDAAYGGDVGAWSTRRPSWFPRELSVLRSLAVGEIAPPVDSLVGFQILRRTENRPRREYAMTAVNFLFNPAAPDGSSDSRASLYQAASSIARQLRSDPSQFEGLKRDNCCPDLVRWTGGPQYPELEPVLDRLRFGEIAAEPVECQSHWLVPRRLDPDTVPLPEVRFALPRREHP
jgi:hypothetical protein